MGFIYTECTAFPVYRYMDMNENINFDLAPDNYLKKQKKCATIIESNRSHWIGDVTNPEFSISLDIDEEKKANNGDKEVSFTLAHELAHYTLHQGFLQTPPTLNRIVETRGKSVMETEADDFAMHLLVPIESLRRYCKNMLNNCNYSETELIALASDNFLTPEEWVTHQYSTIKVDIENYKLRKNIGNINF